MKIQKGTRCLVIKGDKIREGIIIDAMRDMVKVKATFLEIGSFKLWHSKWYPIKGKDVRVEFRALPAQ